MLLPSAWNLIFTVTAVEHRDILHCTGVCRWWQSSQYLEGEETQGRSSSLADKAGLRAADCKRDVLPCQQTGRVTQV